MDWLIGAIESPDSLTEERLTFLKRIGLNCVQLYGAGDYLDDTEKSDTFVRHLRDVGLPPVSIFLFFEHDWDVPHTFGFTLRENRPTRTIEAFRQMDWGKRYGIRDILCHAGYFPTPGTPEWTDIVDSLRPVIKHARDNGQRFLFESGPESADVLIQLFDDFGMDNVGLNLDPANFITYASDNPANVVAKLHSRIFGMHCKDAVRGKDGQRGHQVRIGDGDTDFANLFADLLRRGFRSPMIIEREIAPGPEQEKDIADCLALLHRTIKDVVG